jgi:hypothetical protein
MMVFGLSPIARALELQVCSLEERAGVSVGPPSQFQAWAAKSGSGEESMQWGEVGAVVHLCMCVHSCPGRTINPGPLRE